MSENPWIEYQNSHMNVIKNPDIVAKLELEKVLGPSTTLSPLRGAIQERGVAKQDLITAAVKFDAGKLDWSLMPWDSVEEILKVLEFGKVKYAAWNWSSNGGFKYLRVFNSTMRHLFAWVRGEDNDPESGLSHIAHAGCNIMFLMYFIKNKDKYSSNDDRNV